MGCAGGSSLRIALFDYATGSLTSRFGKSWAHLPGELANFCVSVRFTPDGGHFVIGEMEARRVSVFSTAGEFVRCVGVGMFQTLNDAAMTSSNEYAVLDRGSHCVRVVSSDGLTLVRSWGSEGNRDGRFRHPNSLAMAGKHLYVVDVDTTRVQVFE